VVLAGGVAVEVAHGQAASPNLRVKGSHLAANDRCELSVEPFARSRIMLLPWMCMYGLLYML
jgi:hypothetical protein